MSGSDNRIHPRVDLPALDEPLVIHIQSDTGNTIQRSVTPLNLSRSGMAFVDAAPMKEDTRCILLLKHQGRCMRIIAKVANSRRNDDGGYTVGLKFTLITAVPPTTAGLVLTNNPMVGALLVHLPKVYEPELPAESA